ncbi:hypothetical protein IZ6_09500 [Terrihabitans soli]|uniref:Uncharacterized protein n=1 Tax=Terrihabitans soli TaxID=708113 RepID=A0A6S6QR41_9HYPH|nr:hypothetical protein [Terrihabitans soli]BCJ90215.1 hypothetical protein IZ6_09500 [Terrihabitans soli]
MSVAPVAVPDTQARLAELRDEFVGANINPYTGLSTDYLNHFNEMVMMMELYPSSPDLKQDILDWKVLSYPDHFEATGFRAKALAIEGYALARTAVKKQLDVIVAEIETVLLVGQDAVEAEKEPGEADIALTEATEAAEMLIARASALINGLSHPEEVSADDAQAAVDALFDN